MLVENQWMEWKNCLSEIRSQINAKSFEKWFANTTAVFNDQQILNVTVADSFSAEWLSKHYQTIVQDAVYDTTSIHTRVKFITEGNLDSQQDHDLFSKSSDVPSLTKDGISDISPSSSEEQSSFLTYSFDNFIVGDSNRMAYTAAYALATEGAHTQFNPLFIFGGPGLGKTHLLKALENKLNIESTVQQVVYVTAEEYMRRFIEAIQDRSTRDFKELFRGIDVLLVDDVQFLLKGEHTQNEFFHTFNALHERNCRVVLTCDRSPDKLEGIAERLRSRFKWGLVTSIEQPDFNTRIAIIESKAEAMNLSLGKETGALIANHASSNVREIEGVLTSLAAHLAIHKVDVGVETVNTVLRQRGRVTYGMRDISNIQLAVSEATGISISLMIGRSRKQEVVQARYLAIYLSHTITKDTYSTIGTQFGGRDHSTVLHAIQSMSKRLKIDPTLDELFNELLKKFEL